MTAKLGPRGAGPHVRLVRAASAGCAPPRLGHARACRKQRRARRVRATPLAPETAAAARASLAASGARSRLAGAAVWTLVLAAHAALAVAVWRTRPAPAVARTSTRISVQVHELPSPPPTSPRLAAAPVTPSRAAAPRIARQTAVRVPRAPEPPAAAPPPPVKVVGLSLESTSEAGPGPAFAVGNTLGGTTAATASAPRAPDRPAGPNRVAQGAPRPGSVLTPPRRLDEVKPRYPDARRAAGVEADVLLVVSLDAAGRVLSVTVGRSSGDDAFDESARAAARQERFSPALRDGVPVPTTFTFTTHFRLDTP